VSTLLQRNMIMPLASWSAHGVTWSPPCQRAEHRFSGALDGRPEWRRGLGARVAALHRPSIRMALALACRRATLGVPVVSGRID
jgi:hypothetical protein